MQDHPYQEDKENLSELLAQYENLKNGRGASFLTEESFEKLIDYFDEREELTKALEAAELGTGQYPYSSSLTIKKADVLLGIRRYEEALQTLDKAALLDSRDINLYILKTDAFLALDQPEKAVDLLENALEKFSGEERIDLLFELADVYDDYEEFDKIFDCLKMILEDDPNNEEALYKICFWTDFTGRNEESIKLHTQIINEFPYNELAWFNLAAAYQGLKLYEKSIDAYQYAVTIEEKFDYAYRNMADAYIKLRKYREAIEALQKVAELAKPEDLIYEAIGHCYDKMRNYAQARIHYRKASHLNPGDSKLYYKIALTYFKEGQWQNACKQLETALRIHHQQAEYNLLMGECKMQLGAFKEAIQYFSDAVVFRPKNTAGWEALIRCLFKAGLFEECLEQVRTALQITAGKPVFYYYKSAVLFSLGRSKEAAVCLEEAIDKVPKMLKKFIELNPSILQNTWVVDIIARSKRGKRR